MPVGVTEESLSAAGEEGRAGFSVAEEHIFIQAAHSQLSSATYSD